MLTMSYIIGSASWPKKKTFRYHLYGIVVDPLVVHKHPPFSEIAVKTQSPFGPYLADYFACVPPALKKGWMFYLPIGKKWIPSRSSTTPDRWYWKFFIFGQLRLSLLHIKVPNCRLPKIHVGTKFMLCTYTYHMTH